MSKEKTAWWRGKKVRAAEHSLAWYKQALDAYSGPEEVAFLAGYSGQPFIEAGDDDEFMGHPL